MKTIVTLLLEVLAWNIILHPILQLQLQTGITIIIIIIINFLCILIIEKKIMLNHIWNQMLHNGYIFIILNTLNTSWLRIYVFKFMLM